MLPRPWHILADNGNSRQPVHSLSIGSRLKDLVTVDRVAVKEIKLNHHNGYISST